MIGAVRPRLAAKLGVSENRGSVKVCFEETLATVSKKFAVDAKFSGKTRKTLSASKIVRTEHQFVSHGDFRRYLYEAMVIPMGYPNALIKSGFFAVIFVFRA